MEEALKEVIDQYLNRGFGTMNKNDFEVWIFHYLMQHQLQGKTNYEISVALKIPEQRVKRLRYESELKYPSTTDEDRRLMLIEAISRAKYRQVKDGQIVFALNDKMLRSYLENQLINDGRFYDSSFMSNIIVLSVSDFLFVLSSIMLTESDQQEIIKQVKKNLKESQKLPASFKELSGDMATEFCKKLLENFVGKAANELVDAVTLSIKQMSN